MNTPCINAIYPEYSFSNDGRPRKWSPRRGNVASAITVLWEAKYGSISKGHEPDHLCKNKVCINLDHVEIVTSWENNARGHRKLTIEQVREIRLKLPTTTQDIIAEEYQVTRTAIYLIKSGKSWRGIL